MARVEIRRLEPDDWKVKRDIRLAALRDAPEAFGGHYADARARTEAQWRDWPGGPVFVAYVDDEPTGIAAGVPPGIDGLYRLISMWVSPATRGFRIAGRLTDAVSDWVRHDTPTGGASPVLRLEVKPDNDMALRAYQRAGFEPVDAPVEEPGDVAMDLRLA